MGALSEQDLVRARAELYGMDVVDLARPTPSRRRSISSPTPWPASTILIPIAVDEHTLAVALAD